MEEKKVFAILRKVTVFSELGNEALERLVPTARLLNFRARQVVYLPGDRATGLHFLGPGRVKISKVTRDGKELTLAYRSAGEFFGEACLLDTSPREEMVEAMEPTASVEIAQEAVDAILQTNVVVAYPFLRSVVQRRRDLEVKVEQLIFKDVVSKLAELLMKLGSEYGVENKKGLILSLKITHQEMANLIGSTRETVSLTLSTFKRKGYITTEGRKVILADREGLRGLA